jgi:hypothetical protein
MKVKGLSFVAALATMLVAGLLAGVTFPISSCVWPHWFPRQRDLIINLTFLSYGVVFFVALWPCHVIAKRIVKRILHGQTGTESKEE